MTIDSIIGLLPTQVNYLRPYREKVKFRNEAHVIQDCAMSPWLFNANMDGVEREVNARVLGKGVESQRANGGRFEIHQLLFADDTGLPAISHEKLCRVVTR